MLDNKARIQIDIDNLLYFLLLTAKQNILLLNKGSRGTHFCLSIATLNTFVMLTAIFKPTTIKSKEFLRFHVNNCYANTPRYNFVLYGLSFLDCIFIIQYMISTGRSKLAAICAQHFICKC